MKIIQKLKEIYYRLPIPYSISSKISGRLYTKEFSEEIQNLRY